MFTVNNVNFYLDNQACLNDFKSVMNDNKDFFNETDDPDKKNLQEAFKAALKHADELEKANTTKYKIGDILHEVYTHSDLNKLPYNPFNIVRVKNILFKSDTVDETMYIFDRFVINDRGCCRGFYEWDEQPFYYDNKTFLNGVEGRIECPDQLHDLYGIPTKYVDEENKFIPLDFEEFLEDLKEYNRLKENISNLSKGPSLDELWQKATAEIPYMKFFE